MNDRSEPLNPENEKIMNEKLDEYLRSSEQWSKVYEEDRRINERIRELAEQAGFPKFDKMYVVSDGEELEKFAQLIVEDMHRKVIASILITDVLMEEKGQKPTSEDYIRAINKDFGVEE